MISLIICSKSKDISHELKRNIEETIGVEYELIVVDNSENYYTIFSAYNEGVRRAKYSYLCFMHEDILYHTFDWGKKVINHFINEMVGLIGVIGGHYLPDTPSTWFSTEFCSGKIIQGHKDRDGIYKVFEDKRQILNSDLSIEAVAVDGLWFCVPKHLFDIISFDNYTFKGWHGYDIDICMQIIQIGYDIRVVNDILIEHSSYGNSDKNLYRAMKLFHTKWKNTLPLIRGIDISDEEAIVALNKAKATYNYQYKRTFKSYRICKQYCTFLSEIFKTK